MKDFDPNNAIKTVYQLTCPAKEVESFARDLNLEQTVEVPESIVADPWIRENVVGRIERIEQVDDHQHLAMILYNSELANGQLPQLLNLIFGNISIKQGMRLVELSLPDAFLANFPGPRFGSEGVRQLIGAWDRPLLATAIKPRGSSNETFARIAHDFALGGGDLVKDDHNLVDNDLAQFRERILACHDAVQQANAKTGHRCLYLPNVCAPAGQLERQVELAAQAGLPGVLISPLLHGIDTVRDLAGRYPLVFMSHPTFTGTFFHDKSHGICPSIYLGTLFRLAGCDISVFPNSGGRFGFTAEECGKLAQRLAEPLGQLKPALPSPAGGMKQERIPDMARQYGTESVLLIGGALLSHSSDLAASTAEFKAALLECFPSVPGSAPASGSISEQASSDRVGFASACELPTDGAATPDDLGSQLQHLVFENFNWQGREPVAYKADEALPFAGVSRHELLGKTGEKAAFDLRYFELAAEGYTSHEKHGHTHAVVCLRGEGSLQCQGQTLQLKPMDVAYVPPFEAHQLRNAGSEPFGFLCIVDHHRDRPMAP